jgi:hypothetical protein
LCQFTFNQKSRRGVKECHIKVIGNYVKPAEVSFIHPTEKRQITVSARVVELTKVANILLHTRFFSLKATHQAGKATGGAARNARFSFSTVMCPVASVLAVVNMIVLKAITTFLPIIAIHSKTVILGYAIGVGAVNASSSFFLTR